MIELSKVSQAAQRRLLRRKHNALLRQLEKTKSAFHFERHSGSSRATTAFGPKAICGKQAGVMTGALGRAESIRDRLISSRLGKADDDNLDATVPEGEANDLFG
ncbi:hypothetical protein [Bradyrhizobium sp. JR3.5]